MKLLVDRLRDEPSAHEFSVSPTWWTEHGGPSDPAAEGLVSPLVIRVSARRMGADVFLEGELSGELEPTCSRCLGRYRQPAREPFRLVLEPAGDRVPADPEGAASLARDGLYLADELETGWFGGSELRLGGLVQELIALLVPLQPLCREECRGLCPRCGVDRNLESCDCAATQKNSPFAALGRLRDELSGGKDR